MRGADGGDRECGNAVASPSKQAAEITRIVRDAMSSIHLKAVIVKVTRGDKVIIRKAFGESMADVPATPRMRFRNGAVAYQYLGNLLMQFVDEKKVKLDDTIDEWYPDLPEAHKVTLKMLANQTSGYPDYEKSPAFAEAFGGNPFGILTTQQRLDFAFATPVLFDPGTNWSYAHTNFLILGEILAKVGGKPLDVLLHEQVLRPLGLDDTTATQTSEIPSPVLHTYSLERTGLYEEATFWNTSWGTPPGANQTTTIDDLATTAAALGSGKLLSKKSAEAMNGPNLLGFGERQDNCAPSCFTQTEYYNFGLGVIRQGNWQARDRRGRHPPARGVHGGGELPPRTRARRSSSRSESTWRLTMHRRPHHRADRRSSDGGARRSTAAATDGRDRGRRARCPAPAELQGGTMIHRKHRRGLLTSGVALVLGCVALAPAPASATVAAGASAGREQCSSSQIDIGGDCTSAADAAKQIVSITRSVMTQQDAKAVILRVDVGDRTIVNRGLGISQMGVPATPDMKFRPGAMAIPLLTTLALQLQDEGRLSLDDTLSKWYPDYPNADRVTLRMLASVTSGYPDYIQENPPFQAAQLAQVFRQWTDDELLDYAFAQPIVCDPGTCFHYAHTNFILLGRVVERVTGRSVTELIQRRFVGPLGLRDTRITKLPAIPAPALHAYTLERGVYEESTGWSPSWGLGRGLVMTSTARDMVAVIKAVGTGRLVSKSAARQMFEPLSQGLSDAPSEIAYGLGIDLAGDWVFQNPIFNGYAGILAYLPSRKISILIENTHGPNAVPGSSISTKIFKAVTEYLTPDDPI